MRWSGCGRSLEKMGGKSVEFGRPSEAMGGIPQMCRVVGVFSVVLQQPGLVPSWWLWFYVAYACPNQQMTKATGISSQH